MSTESRNDIEKTLLHTRDVSSKGYIRTDGMFDIEGIITDKKSYDVPKSDRTILKEGDPPVSYTHLTLPTTPYV